MAYVQLLDASAVTVVDIARVNEGDGAEIAKLVRAMEDPGYFYLDFHNAPATETIADDARFLYALADEYFQEPADIKAKDLRRGLPSWSDRGYKSCETDESFEMSRDELRDGQPVLTAPWAKQTELVKSFNVHCDDAVRLNRATGLKLISEPAVPFAADVLENKHRDSGTLTMLFYDSWSMHICHSGDHDDMDDEGQRQWVLVPPPPEGCALVHGASSLTRLSGGRLRAPLHRVTQPVDGAQKRYFLSYFLRPDHRLRGEWVVAGGEGLSHGFDTCNQGESPETAAASPGPEQDRGNVPEHADFWVRAVERKLSGRPGFDSAEAVAFFDGYHGVRNVPAVAFAAELIEVCPTSKVILPTRDVDSWHRSCLGTVYQRSIDPVLGALAWMHPPSRTYANLLRGLQRVLYRGDFPGYGKTAFEEHGEYLRSRVPPEKLLEYRVQQGWGPLCEFLGEPVPAEEFPQSNDRDAFWKGCRARDRRVLCEVAVKGLKGLLVFGAALVVAWNLRDRLM
ncbi:hypothetical protein ACRE_042360 [Hapsidospora chrysogenum ATCC 11550]|uniref:Isopenicillin N synthase-like Fe(2+) 2OG dioxygenase domain-containing protein n=1 Tax=Hapsidospora chrysogenum (strain ATCC 11550 / CBS 779.69 / DSM 880 / IAM 14645 / JCM 23072 / IMI 49137) TaxID=857340 RepID=A0A086T6H3_HAPC1|nr:hypothetical protein ACRE_042360 [Hapsidospora chrysogenum ATCC 11550]